MRELDLRLAELASEQEQIEAKKKLGQRIRQLASEERKRERSALGQIRPDLSGPDRQALAKEEEKSIFCARSFFQRDCMSPFERLSCWEPSFVRSSRS